MKELLNIFPKEIVNYIIFDYLLPTDSFNGVIESLDKHRFLWSISYINSFARYFFSDMKVDKYLRDYQKQKQKSDVWELLFEQNRTERERKQPSVRKL